MPKTFGAQITLPRDPTAPLEAATKQYVDTAVAGGGGGGEAPMVGEIKLWSGATEPAGGKWLLCNGNGASRTTYATLFALIGTTYGAGDGSTTFNLPDLYQRFPLGGGTVGATGGSFSHQHAQTTHVHSVPTTTQTGSGHTHVVPNVSGTGGHNHTIADTGSSGAHSHDNTAAAAVGGTGGQTYGGTTSQHRHTVPSAGSAHTHPIPDASTTQSGHAHTISDATTTGSGHDHTINDTGNGSAGGSTADTGAANPPYLRVNYIIRALP